MGHFDDDLDRVLDPLAGVFQRGRKIGEREGVIGGLSGGTSLGLLLIDLVFLPNTLRGLDVGSRMMAMAEAEGRRRGCRAGMLYTISFQAPAFYQKRGWTVFGEIACDPPGTSRVFLTKIFAD